MDGYFRRNLAVVKHHLQHRTESDIVLALMPRPIMLANIIVSMFIFEGSFAT